MAQKKTTALTIVFKQAGIYSRNDGQVAYPHPNNSDLSPFIFGYTALCKYIKK